MKNVMTISLAKVSAFYKQNFPADHTSVNDIQGLIVFFSNCVSWIMLRMQLKWG